MNYQLLLNTNRSPSMSHKLNSTTAHTRPPLFLKRTLQQHNSIRKDPFNATPSLQLSRQTHQTTRTLPINSIYSGDGKYPLKDNGKDSLSSLQSSSEESLCNNGANIERVHERMSEAIDEDMKLSIRTKQKKSYYHRYEEKEDTGTIWVSKPKWIPRQVQQAYEQCANKLPNNQKVNFLQGFLSQLGFMYYAVERTIFFYDIQTINQDSNCSNIIEIQHKIVNAFYGIQVIDIGPPYISRNRKALLFLHIYQAELYTFCIVRDSTQEKGRMLELKSLNIRYSVANIKPSKFILSKRGIMYYADDKGDLQYIQYDQSFINSSVSQIYLSSKRITQQIKAFWTRLAKNMSQSIQSFAKTVYNFSKTVFRSKALSTSLLYDNQRNLLILFQKRKMNGNFYQQELKIYNQEYMQLLYSVSHDELLDKNSTNDVIVDFKILEERLNNDYNLVALLDSGKRIFYDINSEGLRKSVVYQSPPTNNVKYFTQHSNNTHSVQSSIILQTYFASLIYSNSNYSYSFVRQQISSKYQAVYKLDVQIHGAPRQNEYFMFHRQPEELGPLKHCLLSSQSGSIKVKDMNVQVMQAFYRPQEIVHASDKMIQRIVILRPVDIFFAIVTQLKNMPQISKALQIIFTELKPQEIIRLSCQVLLDEQGVYYVSSRLILNLKVKLSIRIEEHERRSTQNYLNQVSYKDIPKQNKVRIEDLIQDIAKQSLSISKQQKQTQIAIGFIKYLAKLFRTMWFSNINELDSQICRASIQVIQSFKKLISRIKKQLRCGNEGMLNIAYCWCERVRQLMILIRSIPRLPSKALHQIILTQPQQFHQYLFDFLIKYCRPQLSQQLKGSIPIYVNDCFLKTFRLWWTLKQLKSTQQKLKLCKEQLYLPQYFINYISKQRGLQEVKLLTKEKQINPLQIKQIFDNISSYKQILKSLRQDGGGFIQKQLLLQKAEEKLKEQAKYNEGLLNQGMLQIDEIATTLKLQKLIKQFYTVQKRQSISLSQKLTSRLKLSVQSTLSPCEQIPQILQRVLFDNQTLGELVLQTKDELIDIAYANYYMPDQVVSKIHALILKATQQVATVRELPSIFKNQLKYLLESARIALPTEVTAKLYIQKISELPELIEIMRSEEGVLDQTLYFPLSYCVEIKAEVDKLHRWAIKTLNQLDRNSAYFLYLSACATYLVRDFIPSKTQQLEMVLTRGGHNEPILKKLIALLSDKQT